jgi:type IV pilus assembly protein PilC
MLNYTYVAHDPATGKKVKGQVEAEEVNAAANLIRKQGLTPIEIKSEMSGGGLRKYLNKVATKERILFTRQLATLIGAGLPLIQALRSSGEQSTSKALQSIINSLINDIEAGSSFSDAIAKHPKVFNEVYINLVASGEASGTLDKSLDRLASQQEKDADIVSKVRGAFAYPIIVLLVMFAVVGFMIVKVLPAVGTLYNSLPGAKLPFITVLLLDISQFIIHFWWIALIALGLLIFGGSRLARTLGGKRIIDETKMKIWPIGPLFMKIYMARFARTASTLISSGVPIIQVLDITAGAINNVVIAKSLEKAIEKIRGGKALSEVLSKDKNFLTLVPSMLKIGEDSGTIEQMMERVAIYYETEVDNQIKAVSTLIEPILMIVLGIMAFIIVAAVLLPIYGLAGNSSLNGTN